MTTSSRTRRRTSGPLADPRELTFVAIILFCLVFVVSYATYLSANWSYEGVIWRDPSMLELAVVFGAVVATGMFMPRSLRRPSDFCLWIIYTIVVVPGAFLAVASDWLLTFQRLPTALAICVIGTFVRAATAPSQGALLPTPRKVRVNFWAVAGVLLAITYAWLVAAVGINHAFISFADIYSVRSDFKTALAEVPALAYLLPLSYACLNPALIIWGMVHREPAKLLIGVGGDVLIYLASGARLALMSVPLVLWIGYRARRGRPLRPSHLLLLLGFLVVFARIMDSVTGNPLWTAVFSIRILAIPGVLTVGYLKYYQLFPQLGIESFLPGNMPPGKDPLVAVGEWIFHTPGTNANVNFIGSGFMHAGMLGIAIETLMAVLLLRLADDSAADLPTPLRYSFFIVPAFSLANGSAFTSVLTYGFGASIALAYAARLDPRLRAASAALAGAAAPSRHHVSTATRSRQLAAGTDHPTTAGPLGAIQRRHVMDIRDYLRIARRNWALILAVAVILGVLGAANAARSSGSRTATYVSTSALLVSAPTQIPGQRPGPSARDYTQAVLSRDTAQQVTAQLALGITAENLQTHIKAEVPSGTNIVQIAVSYSDAAMAQRINSAILDTVARTMKSADAAIAGPEGSSVRTTILDPPSPGFTAEVGSKTTRDAIIGLVLGLLVGFGLAIARELLDTRVKEPADLPALDGIPVIGRIGSHTPALAEGSTGSESFRLLRANVQSWTATGDNVIVFTSPVGAEGTTTMAATTALALAQSGWRVVLVDANLRRPAVASILGLAAAPGLSSVLEGRTDLATALQRHASSDLNVVSAGEPSDNPSDLLHGEAFPGVLRDLAQRFDIVVVDSAPLLPVADTLCLARIGSIALVVEHGKSKRDHVAVAIERLAVVSAVPRGIVLNRAPAAGPARRPEYAPATAGARERP